MRRVSSLNQLTPPLMPRAPSLENMLLPPPLQLGGSGGCSTSRQAPVLAPAGSARMAPPQEGRGGVEEEPISCCLKWWRAEWNFKPRGPLWLPAIIRMTWYLQVINMLESIQGHVDGDLATPFFYSRTSCCGNSG
eukprot:COSAG01_NODE_14947_length_1392_cov_245.099768_1_plen_134_part_10